MKKNLFIILLLLVSLFIFGACTTIPTELPVAEQKETEAPGQKQQPDEQSTKSDYSDLVYDTSGDSGFMTCRFLYLTEKHPADPTAIRAGDSTVYMSPEGLVMLIDCGNQTSGEQVVEYLKKMGVKRVDIFVASHPHADHIGGFSAVSKAFDIGKVYMNEHEYDSQTYWSMMKIIEEKGIETTRLVEGDEFKFGDQIQVKVYNPEAGFNYENAVQTAEFIANNASLCLKMIYKESSFFSAGDMYVDSESRIAKLYGDELQADVCKMNHHGDSTSNKTEYIEAVKPKIVVAMNEGILSPVVNMRYQKVGAITFYNCVDGTVKVSTSGDGKYEVQSTLIRELTTIGEPALDGHYIVE